MIIITDRLLVWRIIVGYSQIDFSVSRPAAMMRCYRRGTARRLKSVEILSAAAQLYEKSRLTRRIALSCGIKISPVGSLD